MRMEFCLLRDNVTATSVTLDIISLDGVRRWIASSIRGSAIDASKYHFIGIGDIQDISGTDTLEEITGAATGISYEIVNKREISGSFMEFDLEICHKHKFLPTPTR